MTHLGRWLSALVDGELDDIERDLVLNHLAGCSGCRREVNAMRALKRRLTALGEPPAGPGGTAASDITGRLMDLARFSQDLAGPAGPAGPAGAGPAGPALSPAPWPAPRGGHWAGQARPGWKVATASAGAALAAIALVAFMLGSTGPQPRAPRIIPSVDAYWLQHGYDTGQAPAAQSGPALPDGPVQAGSGAFGGGTASRERAHSASGGPAARTQPAATPASVPGITPAVATPGHAGHSSARHVVRYVP